MTRQIQYVPILVDSSDNEVNLTYVMVIPLDVGSDVDHLDENQLKTEAIRTEKTISTGIAKYRDSLIPKHVHEDLASGKCRKIILDYSVEGYWDIDWNYISTLFGIPLSKIVWVTSIWDPKFLDENNEVTAVFTNQWERFLHGHIERTVPNSLEIILPRDRPIDNCPIIQGLAQQIKDIRDLKIRKYHGLSYNRMPHVHRIYLLTKLKTEGLLGRTSYSWGGNSLNHNNSEWNLKHIEYIFNQGKELKYLISDDNKSLNEIMKSKQITFPNEELKTNKADSINFDHIKDCYFQIITETVVDNYKSKEIKSTPFLSEKSYKSFISGMPFVMWGQAGTVNALSEQGYHCYNKWIDHSYDSITDSSKRLETLMTEIKRLYAIPSEQWSIMLKEMLPVIEHNIKQSQRFNRENVDFINDDFREPMILNVINKLSS